MFTLEKQDGKYFSLFYFLLVFSFLIYNIFVKLIKVSSLFQGLLKMKLLPRLRYILEVVRPSPRVVQDIMEVLTCIARHSSSSATQVTTVTATIPVINCINVSILNIANIYFWSNFIYHVLFFQVLDCPRLMETVISEFLPTSWTAPSLTLPQSVYRLPLASSMKLLRVLATSGRHVCARLVSAIWNLSGSVQAVRFILQYE